MNRALKGGEVGMSHVTTVPRLGSPQVETKGHPHSSGRGRYLRHHLSTPYVKVMRILITISVFTLTACGPSVSQINSLSDKCTKAGGKSAWVLIPAFSSFVCKNDVSK